LETDEVAERAELAGIYVQRGLEPALASRVALQLMKHDALAAHARDELGLSATHRARPLQAALASASSFAAGAALPLLMVLISPARTLMPVIGGSSLLFLALLGGVAARAGGAPIVAATVRVTFWGGLAMAVTAAVGSVFGAFA
ncbi:MAG TPA: VIT1/CCC1 transporter family protein, partial [Steroidobacteraceae bacterium]|nr:VIT1/CCC1 transporter family protein [Steroidobacteraceae bacterium]